MKEKTLDNCNVKEKTLDNCNVKEKTLDNCNVKETKKNISDLKIYGDGDTFKLICKASSKKEGWMKSTKAMEIEGGGCLIQVTTQQRNPDGSYAIAEALAYIPKSIITHNDNDIRRIEMKQAIDK